MGHYDFHGAWHPDSNMLKTQDAIWSISPDVSTGEDLREGSQLYIDTQTQEVCWRIYGPGCPRTPFGLFIVRHDPHTGITYTKIEGMNG